MKYAVITGSSNGIGYAIAKEFVKNGYYVFLNGRRNHEIDLPKDSYFFIEADMSTFNGISVLADTVIKHTDKIDALILNAGITCRKSINEISYAEWQKVMDMNVNLPFFLIQLLVPHINKNGNILFIGSSMGIKPHGTSLPYGVSKSAVISLSQNLVKELPNIRINCICPGFVNTEWQREKPQWLKDKISAKISLNRFAEPSEIADMCYKIISNTYMNGAVINIDGGYDMK